MHVLLVILSFFSAFTFADTNIRTQVHDIDRGQVNELPLIFLSTGQVVTYPNGKKSDFDLLEIGVLHNKWFLITINNKKEIVTFKEVASPPTFDNSEFHFLNPTPFIPSILKDMTEARNVFSEARSDSREESQCFNRAHIWSYEWRIQRKIYSSKAWLFFTRKFIRKYKFEWWFHVAPMVHVVHEGQVKERVMDIKYAKGPLMLKQWTDIFMRDNAHCPVVDKYSDQANFPESGSCFVMKSSMYYYQPIDLELLEMKGSTRSMWIEPEVKHAYLDAFNLSL